MATKRLFIFSMLTLVVFSKAHSYSLRPACELAEDTKSCNSSLLQADPRSSKASPKNLTIISLEKSLSSAEKVYDLIPPVGWAGGAFPSLDVCSTFYDLAIKHLKEAQTILSRSNSTNLKWSIATHIQTLLSAALTNQRTCTTELHYAHVNLSQFTFTESMEDASVAVSHSLALVNKQWIMGKAPVDHKRRLLSDGDDLRVGEDGFPRWASRKLLQSLETSERDAVVAQDGSGHHSTIADAIRAAPSNNRRSYVIHIRRGVYRENIIVPYDKPNLVFVGDGVDHTVITTNKNTADGILTPNTAAAVVFANGFVALDITFQNTAGPKKYRGLAMLMQSDKAVLYRCKFDGYQDTLFAYAMRQFYRDCQIYGTIDFIAGNPRAVFQRCSIYIRTPIFGAENVITAMDRVSAHENTAMVLDNCTVTWSPDAAGRTVPTFLGRPWGSYSRTVVRNSYLGGLIDPQGWLPWDGRDDSRTVAYGEYKNSGPGADTSRRLKWRGIHVLNAASVRPFTTSALLQLQDWLPPGVPADRRNL